MDRLMQDSYPRDLVGYGRNPPQANWPGGARVALQFVLNYEEGGENNILHGDAASEAFLSEIVGAVPWPGQRHINMESIYEYGSRAGFWRLYRMFGDRGLPLTVFAVAKARERNPEPIAAMKEVGWEIASHGLKWIDYKDYTLADERAHVLEAIRLHTRLTGERPLGFYQGRASEHTMRIVMEEGGFLYASDSYADDLPYWVKGTTGPQLVVPYTLDANDMRFAAAQGFNSGDQFFTYLKDSFDTLYAEGESSPKMLSIGLHSRLVGRPGRAAALARFLDYVLEHDKVWVATRLDIAKHWIANHAPPGGFVPSQMSRTLFVERFGGIYEHSAWVAQDAFDRGLGGTDTAGGLARRMSAAVAAATQDKQLALVNAHPDLSGRLAQAKLLTADSTFEQASAGLDRLTAEELTKFTQLNDAYKAKFGFVFIMAVRGRSKDEILQAFERRLQNSPQDEFREALVQIDRIAELRLSQMLPA